jgi:hypothetical protein
MKELKENISDNFMISIYTILIETIERLTNENIVKSVDGFEKIKSKFLELKKQEEREIKKEEIENTNILINL